MTVRENCCTDATGNRFTGAQVAEIEGNQCWVGTCRAAALFIGTLRNRAPLRFRDAQLLTQADDATRCAAGLRLPDGRVRGRSRVAARLPQRGCGSVQ